MNDTKKILLVEDDPEIVENLTEFLRTEGYSVTSVPTQKFPRRKRPWSSSTVTGSTWCCWM